MCAVLSQTSDIPLEYLLGPLGLLAFLLVVVVYGGRKRWWVFGWQYEELRVDRDAYRELAHRSTSAAESATSVAKGSDTARLEQIARLVAELAERPEKGT